MKKLDDIPKKNVFDVPEGYFDRLPMRIQSRLESAQPAPATLFWRVSLRYALPVIIAGLALAYFMRPRVNGTEELLASISDEHLVAFLAESDISENDLLEVINFDEKDADSLNQHLSTPLLDDNSGMDKDEFKRALENEL